MNQALKKINEDIKVVVFETMEISKAVMKRKEIRYLYSGNQKIHFFTFFQSRQQLFEDGKILDTQK